MSIADQINRLNNAKANIKQSIENKGVTVSDSALLDEYPALIDSIEVGSGGGGNPAYEAYFNLKTKDNTYYYELFYNYKGIELDVSELNTSNVTDMSKMFSGCNNLTELDVSNWNTGKVTDMGYIFYNCRSLTQLDVSNWDTSKVTNMYQMFHNCKNLKSLDLSNFDTSNVTNMYGMFFSCDKLQILDLSNFDTSNVDGDYGMTSMFSSCSSLHTLRLDNCDRATISRMIASSASLPTSNIGTTRIIHCEEANAVGLTAPKNWRFSFEPEEIPYKFTDNTDITEVTADTVTITSEHTDLSEMFSGCYNLYSVDTNNWYTSNVTNMERMFYGCNSLSTIDGINSWYTGCVSNMSNMFNSCSNLYSLDLSNWYTSSCNYMSNMFYGCGILNELNISNFDATNVWDNMGGMFADCFSLAFLHLDYCSYETVEKIINSEGFPVDNYGVIYCSYDVYNYGLTPPGNWTFEAVY